MKTRFCSPARDFISLSEIGNTPYIIDENNTDYYPLLQQVNIPSSVPAPTPSFSIGDWIPPVVIPVVIAALALEVVIVSLLLYRRHRKTINSSQQTVSNSGCKIWVIYHRKRITRKLLSFKIFLLAFSIRVSTCFRLQLSINFLQRKPSTDNFTEPFLLLQRKEKPGKCKAG
jgi:hypothetical protein